MLKSTSRWVELPMTSPILREGRLVSGAAAQIRTADWGASVRPGACEGLVSMLSIFCSSMRFSNCQGVQILGGLQTLQKPDCGRAEQQPSL